jgi:hypothetical protein
MSSQGKDGGSGSSGTGDSGGQGQGAAKNKTAKMSMDQVMAENVALKQQITDKDSIITDLTGQLKEANDVLEGQEKQRLIGEILPRSSFKADELAGKTIEELKSIRATLDQALLPKVNSTRFGVFAADVSDREKGLTVGDLSVVTAKKRKDLGAE